MFIFLNLESKSLALLQWLTRFRLNLILIDLCTRRYNICYRCNRKTFDSGGVPFWPSFAVGTEKVIENKLLSLKLNQGI